MAKRLDSKALERARGATQAPGARVAMGHFRNCKNEDFEISKKLVEKGFLTLTLLNDYA